MQKMRTALFAALAVTVAAGLWSAPASAGNLDNAEVGAALALPFATGTGAVRDASGDLRTYQTITNALPYGITLDFQVINGDVGGDWRAESFSCHVTARETTLIRITSSNGASVLNTECSSSFANENSAPEELNIPISEALSASRGIVFVSVSETKSLVSANEVNTLSEDAIFGDWVMIDGPGGFAFGSNAISFQGKSSNNGDRVFQFDGFEYARFPNVLASNFIAPDDTTEAVLVLFTLDGKVGTPPRVDLQGNFYNDDERKRDFTHDFRCMDVVALEDLNPNFQADFLCPDDVAETFQSPDDCAGHFDLRSTFTQPAAPDFNDSTRRRPFHGWIVQASTTNGSQRTWARTLDQSTTSFVPLTGDVPAFDAGQANAF